MNRTWKWILIGLGIFILAFCVALPLFVGIGTRFLGYGGMPMMGRRFGFLPFMGPFMGRGFGMGGFGLLGFLFPLFALLVLILVIVGIVVLLRRPQRPVVATAMPAETVTPIDATPAEPVTPVPEAVETHPCPHCGAPVQTGWVACPHCGEKLV